MNTQENQENYSFDIIKEIRYFLFFWPWFLVSVLLFSVGSFLYLRYQDTIFYTSAILQVKDASSDPTSFLTESSMFNVRRSKTDNYISQIGSRQNLSILSDRLDLQTLVYTVGRVKETIIYGDEIPFEIVFKSNKFKGSLRLILESSKGIIEISEKAITFDLSQPFETDDFKLIVNNERLNFRFDKEQTLKSEFLVYRSSKEKTIADLSRLIGITSSSKDGDNIDLKIQGSNIERNEEIINTLIEVAHQQQKSDKQEIYALSIDFINKRLISIKDEIDSLTLETIGFKSDNLIFSPQAQTAMALQNISSIDQEYFDLSTQKEFAISLQRSLKNQDDFSLLPSNIGLANANVNELVVSYNKLVLKRKNLLSSATTRNPLVVQLSEDLTDLRMNIIKSIDHYISNIETSLSEFKEFQNRTNSEISKIPNLEATLLSNQRKFQIAEKLYLFLLESLEKVSISYESTLPSTSVLNYAFTDFTPVSPKKQNIYLGSIMLGLFLPFAVLYLLKLIDSKIHTREELEKLIPNLDILGEVPFVKDLQTIKDSRGILAESSRVIRSNISFKLNESKDSYVILSTSSIKGEGKTMTAFNTATSYVAAGNKVLLIGADLRNPQVHKLADLNRKTNTKGLSTLISNGSVDVDKESIVTIDVFNSHLDILLSGPIPPNPAELLGSENFLKLLEALKRAYDYIIIDSAPLVLVSDTIPLLKTVDLVLYTTRAHYTDRKLVPFINSLIEDKKVNNIGVVLNGIKAGATSYYKYGYSYRYSYQYKYNYGYGYGYGEDVS